MKIVVLLAELGPITHADFTHTRAQVNELSAAIMHEPLAFKTAANAAGVVCIERLESGDLGHVGEYSSARNSIAHDEKRGRSPRRAAPLPRKETLVKA
jgi:hypothetical protein